jgi:serine/threonine protein kinase
MGSPLAAGTVVAGFRIESLLGEGAMGAVYLAEEPPSGARVALKLLSTDLARDERFRQRFLRESRVAASLEGGRDRRRRRRSARRRPRRRPHPPRREARQHPRRRRRRPRLRLRARSPRLVRPQLDGRTLLRRHDRLRSAGADRGRRERRTADVYSLGCVLFECLTGQRPFDRESELAVVFAHLNEPPPRVTDLRPELPAAFGDVLATALAKKPGGRYGSCGELAAAARAALRGKRRRRRKQLKLAAAAAALTAVVAGGIAGRLLATRGSSSGRTRRPTKTRTSRSSAPTAAGPGS